jgi:hypothetical protein
MKTVYKITKLGFNSLEDIPATLCEYNIGNIFEAMGNTLETTDTIGLDYTTTDYKLQQLHIASDDVENPVLVFGDFKDNELVNFFNSQVSRANYYKALSEKGQAPFPEILKHYARNVGMIMCDPNRNERYKVDTLFKNSKIADEMKKDMLTRYERSQKAKLDKIEDLYNEMCKVYASL